MEDGKEMHVELKVSSILMADAHVSTLHSSRVKNDRLETYTKLKWGRSIERSMS